MGSNRRWLSDPSTRSNVAKLTIAPRPEVLKLSWDTCNVNNLKRLAALACRNHAGQWSSACWATARTMCKTKHHVLGA